MLAKLCLRKVSVSDKKLISALTEEKFGWGEQKVCCGNKFSTFRVHTTNEVKKSEESFVCQSSPRVECALTDAGGGVGVSWVKQTMKTKEVLNIRWCNWSSDEILDEKIGFLMRKWTKRSCVTELDAAAHCYIAQFHCLHLLSMLFSRK